MSTLNRLPFTLCAEFGHRVVWITFDVEGFGAKNIAWSSKSSFARLIF